MATSAVEIERKYDVPAGLAVPDLSALPGVAALVSEGYELDATYFDTDDLALRAAGMTLRRRTGGGDAGWHLKLPYGVDREEIHLDLGDDSDVVPAELQALVRARSRQQELVPVARLATTRGVHRLLDQDGAVLAELADDVVRGQTLGGATPGETPELRWREWEVELGAGPRVLLDAAEQSLLGAGAVPSGSGSKVGRVLGARPQPDGRPPWWQRKPVTSRKVTAGGVVVAHLREQVEELLARDPQVRRDQPDALHKMRVATRRLRSALQSFRPLLDRAEVDPLRAELQWLAGVLGAVRDTEVMHARLRALVAEQDPELVVGPVAARIDTVLSARYRQAHDVVLAELEGARYLRLLDDLDALVDDPPLLPDARRRAAQVLAGPVRKTWKRLDRAMTEAEQATGQEQDLLLHEARKDAKRARYAAEAVAGYYGRPATAYAKEVTRLQEVLGEHQDGVVTREALRELASAADEAGESAFTYGRLHGLEQARAEQAAARWREVHARASDRSLRRWLRAAS
ncbi:MAG TPA: CYTH and CHAD domain-containing protein [Mycobacteriales bacterium]|nr:CYTH and CHAD domain-containing protein [Mycobacteriales bacterium]